MSQPTERLSCETCRKRKIKCQRVYPCTQCRKACFTCIFPKARRRPRDSRSRLVQRLQSLETNFQALASSLNAGVVIHQYNYADQDTAIGANVENTQCRAIASSPQPVVEELGRLNVRDGQSRYSSNALWASLSVDITAMRELLDGTCDESENSSAKTSPSPSPWDSNNPPSIFGAATTGMPRYSYLPSPADSIVLWTIYKTNVAPVVPIFHLPSLERVIESYTKLETLTTPEESILCSICLAAVVSLSDDQCQDLLREPKAYLLKRYRRCMQMSLDRADLVNTYSLKTLQAFVLYLTSLRRIDETRLVLSWTGLAIRIAMSMGLHRDGLKFGLDPFVTEMRRRVWWSLLLLDTDLSEDHGVEPLIHTSSFDTAIPLNINDTDLHPAMDGFPVEREGFAELTPFIVRCEISMRARDLLFTSPSGPDLKLDAGIQTHETRAKVVEQLQTFLNERFVRHCSDAKPIQWATKLLVRTKCTILWMSVYHPMQRQNPEPSQEMRDKLFSTVTDVVDDIRRLESDPSTAHWGWFFHNDIQWPALVYLLNEVIKRTPGPEVDRAWSVIKAARAQWRSDCSSNQSGMLWRPMKTLTTKAMRRFEGLGSQAEGRVMPQSEAASLAQGLWPYLTLPGSDRELWQSLRWLEGPPTASVVTEPSNSVEVPLINCAFDAEGVPAEDPVLSWDWGIYPTVRSPE